jgi:hypothetical protein
VVGVAGGCTAGIVSEHVHNDALDINQQIMDLSEVAR